MPLIVAIAGIICVVFKDHLIFIFGCSLFGGVVLHSILEGQRKTLHCMPHWWRKQFNERYKTLVKNIETLEFFVFTFNVVCSLIASYWALYWLWEGIKYLRTLLCI